MSSLPWALVSSFFLVLKDLAKTSFELCKKVLDDSSLRQVFLATSCLVERVKIRIYRQGFILKPMFLHKVF